MLRRRLVVDAKTQQCLTLAEFMEKNEATGVMRHVGLDAKKSIRFPERWWWSMVVWRGGMG